MTRSLVETAARPVRRSNWMRNPALLFGTIIVGFVVIVAVFAAQLAPHSPYEQLLSARLRPPVFMGGTWDHILGTDHLGRDYLSRLIYGARLSLLVGIGTVAISALFGVTLGVIAGYYRGWIDLVVMFFLTVRLSLPLMLVALAIVGLLGNSLGLVMLVLASLLWDRFLVVARATTLRLRDAEYIQAARSLGFPTRYIMLREVLPNILGPVIVVATFEMAHAILLEAALSFLGLGVRPPSASWGLMIAEAKDFVFLDAWLVNIPGIAIFTLIAGVTLVGAGLQQKLSTSDG